MHLFEKLTCNFLQSIHLLQYKLNQAHFHYFFTWVFFDKILDYQKDVSHIGNIQCINKKKNKTKNNTNQYQQDFIHILAFSAPMYIILKGFYNDVLKKINTLKWWAVYWLFI